ncbi:MAG TPA: DUF2066 domain-containing protein [Chromatiales bacterium]|nr:DUF2066 domain-containing protein [Chromatiales bacterium]
MRHSASTSPHLALLRALLMALWASWGAGAALAAAPDGLYTARIPVATGGDEERKAAFRKALEQVLVKLTGRREAAGDPRARSLLDHAERWVTEYRYLAPTEADSGYLLEVRFQPQGLRTALRKAGLPLWPSPRPTVLAWVAVDDGGERRFLEAGEPAAEVLTRTAENRGLEVMLPLLDLEDRSRVQPADLLGGFDEGVRKASGRYAPDAVLAAAAKRRGDAGWRLAWRLYLDDARLDWKTSGTRLDQALAAGIHTLADRLAQRLTPASGRAVASDTLLISVEGIDSMAAFTQLRAYLENASALQGVQPWRVLPGRAVFRATVTGDPEAAGRALAGHGGPLEALPPTNEVESAGGRLLPVQYYRWVQPATVEPTP